MRRFLGPRRRRGGGMWSTLVVAGIAGILIGVGSLVFAHVGTTVTGRVDHCTVIHYVGNGGSRVWCYVDVPGRLQTRVTAAHVHPAGASIPLRETGRGALTDPATARTAWWALPLGVGALAVGLFLRWPPRRWWRVARTEGSAKHEAHRTP